MNCQTGFYDADGDPLNGCEFDFLQNAIDNGFEPVDKGCAATGLPLWWLLTLLGILKLRKRPLDSQG